jgi:NAD(P)-dependent dehydrogenase (short-subunit alcohol dehydrogenase family)
VDLGLDGKRCLVTGSTAGIGLEVVRQLAHEGARVVSSGRRGAPDVGEDGHVVADLARAGEPERVVDEATRHLGGLDVLVNNVGIGHAAAGSGESDWEATFRVNLLGTVRCSERVLPGMCERRHGKIVNIASISGHAARRTGGAYSVSKAAVLRYTNGLAVEVAPFSVNVNAVCPGAVWTGMQSGPFSRPEEVDPRLAGLDPYDAFLEYYRPITPLGRPQTAEEVGKAVAYLASADASNITGQCLHVDGGAILG